MIHFPCPHCGKELVAAFEKEGRKAKCSECKTVLIVPPPEADLVPEIRPIRAVECDLAGIGGWLILPALWLTLGTVGHAVQLTPEYLTVFHILFSSLSEGVLWVLVLLDTALFVFRIYVAFRFFGRHRSVPKLMIVFLVLGLASWWCDWLLASSIAGAIADPTRVVVAAIFCATWIPYFLVSRRVKATFVVGITKENDPMIYKNRTSRQVSADLEAAAYAKKEGDSYVYMENSPAARVKRAWESFMLMPKQHKITLNRGIAQDWPGATWRSVT